MLPGGMIEWPIPAERQNSFSMEAMVTQVRAHGFFFDGVGFYVRHDMMVGMALSTEQVAPPVVRKDLQ